MNLTTQQLSNIVVNLTNTPAANSEQAVFIALAVDFAASNPEFQSRYGTFGVKFLVQWLAQKSQLNPDN